MAFWHRWFKLQEGPVQQDGPKPVAINLIPLGSSGIENYSGYYQEDYLSQMTGTQRADFFDRMVRSDPILVMSVGAVKSPIKAANWSIDPGAEGDPYKLHAEFAEHLLFRDMDKPWSEFLHEALSSVHQGYALFEVVDKVVLNNKRWGNYNGIASIAFRSQRTIERFNLDPKTGHLLSVDQYAYGDLQRLVTIPADYLMPIVLNKEGDNYEGVSLLRSCVGAYKRKDHHLKSEAIGIDKYAIPTPVLKVPEGKDNSPEKSVAEAVLKKYVTHEQQFISIPFGWEIEFLKNEGFDASKIREAVVADNTEMVSSFIANFLNLGTQSSGGSYALSFDLSDFFLGSIEHIAKIIAENVTRKVIKRAIDMKFGPQDFYPAMRVSGISDRAGKELADVIKVLSDAKVIVPDDKLEDDIRKRFGLPLRSLEGQRKQEPQKFIPMSEVNLSESVKMADPKKQIKEANEELYDLMQGHLKNISQNMINQIMGGYRNLTESKKLDAIKGISTTGKQAYQAELLDILAAYAGDAIDQAKREVKLSESIYLAKRKGVATIESLPPKVRKRITEQSALLVDTQMKDLEKNIFFQYQSSVDSTDSESLIESDLTEKAEFYINGPSVRAGASKLPAQVINDSRNALFFDEEVLEEIESFTFVNGDPVSPICQELAGTTFSAKDANADRYWPPLHFGCKSYIVPNLKGGKNPEIGKLDPSKRAQKSIQFQEPTEGMSIQAIQIDKKVALTKDDAKNISLEWGITEGQMEESESTYKIVARDPSLFVEGTMKSLEPTTGIIVWMGLLKPPVEMAEGMKLQTIIVSKSKAKTVEEARKIAQDVGAKTTDKVDETDSSFRFRQDDPSNYVEGSFRTKAIPEKGASLVYGRTK